MIAITDLIQFNNLRGDIFGSVTAAVVSSPLALAFGVESLGGLYGAVCGGFLAALFGAMPTVDL